MAHSKGHTHKYMRVNIGGKKGTYFVYRCVRPQCTHYLRPEMLPGMQSVCWACSDNFIITLANLNQVKVRCGECTKKDRPEKETIGTLASVADDMIKKLNIK